MIFHPPSAQVRPRPASRLRHALLAATALGAAALAAPADAQTLTAVKHSALRVLDPIVTTAYMSRNHGYMVFDTLFALDENFKAQPQMVDSWEANDDNTEYTFTLRDGLTFRDRPA